jgi:hypothetical protein
MHGRVADGRSRSRLAGAKLGRLFGMMAAEDLVECDDEVFPGLCQVDDRAQGCFQIFDSLMEGVTDQAVIESSRLRQSSRTTFLSNQGSAFDVRSGRT